MKATVIVALSLALFGCFVSIAKGAVDDNLPYVYWWDYTNTPVHSRYSICSNRNVRSLLWINWW